MHECSVRLHRIYERLYRRRFRIYERYFPLYVTVFKCSVYPHPPLPTPFIRMPISHLIYVSSTCMNALRDGACTYAFHQLCFNQPRVLNYEGYFLICLGFRGG